MASRVQLRRWQPSDGPELARLASDRRVWINLRDRFPYPYTLDDANTWIAWCQAAPEPAGHFAIETGGRLVGGLGVEPFTGNERIGAEVGYWLGVEHWGQGLATEALVLLTEHAFAAFPLERLQATVFSWNPASARVLEKAGYRLEGRLRSAVIKDGHVTDVLVYGRIRDRKLTPGESSPPISGA